MQYADRALMEGLKGRCAMLLHPHVTPDSALLLLQQALAMDSDRYAYAPHQTMRCSLHTSIQVSIIWSEPIERSIRVIINTLSQRNYIELLIYLVTSLRRARLMLCCYVARFLGRIRVPARYVQT